MSIRGSEAGPIVDRLRMMSDERREAYWPNRSTAEMVQLWTLPGDEVFNLLPPSERKVRSKCCASVASWTFFHGERQQPKCHRCGRIVSNIVEPADFKMDAAGE